MLKRVSTIKAVGCFRSANPASVEFGPLTFVYGENSYGKSTLCEVLRSLADNTPEYIKSRVSAPPVHGASQRVQLGFCLPGASTESQFVFDGSAWNPVLPQDLQLLVFDTDFIHRNVFTGLSIGRQNQENLTEFIIGQANVAKARQIADLNSELRSTNKRIRELEQDAFPGIDDVPSFVLLQVAETPQAIEDEMRPLQARIGELERLHESQDTAASRPEPSLIAIQEGLRELVTSINDCLASTYQRVHTNARERVLHHIKSCTNGQGTTEQWLRRGLDHTTNGACPFCGQDLGTDACDLIAAYREYFDAAFDKFVSDTNRDLNGFPTSFAQVFAADLLDIAERNRLVLSSYPELQGNTEFCAASQRLESATRPLSAAFDSLRGIHHQALDTLKQAIERKKTAVHQAGEPWEFAGVLDADEHLRQAVGLYNEALSDCLASIRSFKSSLEPDTLSAQLQELNSELAKKALLLKRATSDKPCTKYSQLTQSRTDIAATIGRLRGELETAQQEFVRGCFEQINSIFSRLGSREFRISKTQTRRGNMPVLQLTAEFAGVPITDNRLRSFFSESDRRALAFSIFWARAEMLSSSEKASTVLVLDDPVTSFDDGRVDRAIRLIDGARASFRQVIVLSHYPRFLDAAFTRARATSSPGRVLRIVKEANGSQLQPASPRDFTESEHQRKYRRLTEFVEHTHREDVLLDARVYLEHEVHSRYHKQIAENGLEALQFRELCNRLLGLGLISTDVRSRLEELRLSLNPSHHIWTGQSHEDKVDLVAEVLEFIYAEL